MILVDTSVWIELLRGTLGATVSDEDLARFATCGAILQEVLQGQDWGAEPAAFRANLLALPRLSDPLPFGLFLEGAEIFRLGRRKGYTIRSSIDCLIAAIAIANRVPVWHRNRDFAAIARYTGLECFR